MKNKFLKFGAIVYLTSLGIFILTGFFSSIVPVNADTRTTGDGCKVEWTVTKPGGIVAKESFTIYKDQLTGYIGKAVISGDTCKYYYGRFSMWNESLDNLFTGPCVNLYDQLVRSQPITFTDEWVSTYKKFDLDFWAYPDKECSVTIGGTENTVLATYSDKNAPDGSPTDNDPDPNEPPPGGGSTIVQCKDASGKVIKTIDVSKGEKCPPGSVQTNSVPPSVADLYNPIQSDSLIGLGFRIMKGFLGGVAALAIVFIVMGSIRLIVSRGNPEQLTRGKDILIWSILGLVVALMAFSLTAIVQNLLGAF